MPEIERVEYGKVGRPHGLRGELRFFPHNPESPILKKIRKGLLVLGDKNLPVNIAAVRGSDDAFVIRFVEITSREDAALWTHGLLMVESSVFPEIDEEDTYYYWQLEGLEARTDDGERVGTVRFVQNYGAGDLLIIRGARGDMDIPFMEPWVGDIDLDAGVIVVNPHWLESE